MMCEEALLAMKLTKSTRQAALSLFVAAAALTGCGKDGPEPVTPVTPPTTKPDPVAKVTYVDRFVAADSVVTSINAANNGLTGVQAIGRAQIVNAAVQGTGTMEIVNLNASGTGKAAIVVRNGHSYLTFPELANSGSTTVSAADKNNYTYVKIQEKAVSGIDTTYTTTNVVLNQKGAYLAIKDPNIKTVDQFISKMKSSSVTVTGFSTNPNPGSTANITGPNAPVTNPGTTEVPTYALNVSSGYIYYDMNNKKVVQTSILNANSGGIKTNEGTGVSIKWVGLEHAKAEVINKGEAINLTWPQNNDNDPNNDVEVYGEYSVSDASGKVTAKYKMNLTGKYAVLAFITEGNTLTNPSVNYNGAFVAARSNTSNQKVLGTISLTQ